MSHGGSVQTMDEDGVVMELRATVGELRSSSEASAAQITEITSLASSLCADIATAQSAFGAGRLFAEVVTRCRGTLMQLSSDMGNAPNGVGAPALSGALEGLASRYTMQSQREVHAAVANAGTAGMPQPGNGDVGAAAPPEMRESGTDAAGAGEACELGDNVELF
jgi:hypothetical protein